jgi:predicted site-specific integrase-resolvase
MSASLANGTLRAYNGSTKLSRYANKLGLHDNTAKQMFQRGQIAGSQLPTGTVIIKEPVEMAGVRDAIVGTCWLSRRGCIQVHTSFCARLDGRRRAKGKTQQVVAALQQNGPAREQKAGKSD